MTASTKTTETAKTTTAAIKLPEKSLGFFLDLANDAGNWSGNPWLTGNVSAGRSASGMTQTLVRNGLIVVEHGGDTGNDAYAVFTPKGVEFAKAHGVDIDYLLASGNVASPKAIAAVEAHEAAKATAKAAKAPAAKATAKAEPKAPAAKATPAKATPAKATPAKATPAKATPAKAPAAPRPEFVKVAADLPEGYFVRWPHKSYDLATTKDKTAAVKWFVTCNAHGTKSAVDNAKAGDQAGSKAGRVEWCKKCKADAAK